MKYTLIYINVAKVVCFFMDGDALDHFHVYRFKNGSVSIKIKSFISFYDEMNVSRPFISEKTYILGPDVYHKKLSEFFQNSISIPFHDKYFNYLTLKNFQEAHASGDNQNISPVEPLS